MNAIAQDEAMARALGLTYGALKALQAPRRTNDGSKAAAALSARAKPRYCINCGKPLSGRQRIYCDAECSNRFRCRKYYARKKAHRIK